MSFQVGDVVGEYRVTGIIGHGAMGQVFRVEHAVTKRSEAMKVLADEPNSEEQSPRFIREIQLQASLHHPNIAAVHHAFRASGRLVMVMELVEGESLQDRLARGRIPLPDAVRYAREALTALAHAHASGVLHRDISPANIIIAKDGCVKLTDFGLAKSAADLRLTQSGAVIGSLPYMSPEQVRNLPSTDSRADLYSLGAVLYEMATGRRPFDGDSAFSIMLAHVEQRPAPPHEVDASVPPGLGDVILKALAKEPDHRYQSAGEFLRALSNAAVSSPRTTARAWAQIAAAAAVVAVLLATFVLWRRASAPLPDTPAFAEAPVEAPVEKPVPRESPAAPLAAAAIPAVTSASMPAHHEPQPQESSRFAGTRSLSAGIAVWSLAFSPDGRWIAAGTDRNTVEIWDLATGHAYATLHGHEARVTALCFSPDGRRLASGSGDRTVKLWDLGERSELRTYIHQDAVSVVAFSADGRWLASGSSDKRISVWDAEGALSLHALSGQKHEPRAIAFGPGGVLASVSADKAVLLWTVSEERVVARLRGPEDGATAIAYSPDGRFLAAAGLNRMKVWDTSSGAEVHDLAAPGWLHAIAFTREGHCLLANTTSKRITVWDADSSEAPAEYSVGEPARTIAFGAGGKLLAAAGETGVIRIWPAKR